jgi:hypothetical protein
MHCTTTTKDTKEGSPPKKTQRKDNITIYIHTYIHTYIQEREKKIQSFIPSLQEYLHEEEGGEISD